MIEQENRAWAAATTPACARPTAATSSCSTPTPGSSATGSTELVAFADAHPEAAVVGPRLRNTDGTLQRSVRGEPTLWRLATEYLFIRKLAPRSRRLNPLYAGGFDHDEVTRGRLALRACAARPPRGGRRGRPLRRGLLHVQRGGRLDDALPPRRAGRCCSSRAPRSCTSAAPRTAARCTSRTCAATCASSPSTAGRRRPSACAACCSGRCACAPPCSAASEYREGVRFLASGDARTLLRVIDYLRLAFGTLCVLAPGCGRRARARAAQRLGGARVDDGVRLRRVGGRLRAARSIHLAVAVLAVILVGALRRRASSARDQVRATRPRFARRGWPPASCSAGSLWHVEGVVTGDGLFHEARVRKLVDLGDLHLRTVDEFKDGGLHPGYAFPLWHGFLALVAWFSGLDPGGRRPARAVAARAARVSPSPGRPASPSSARASAGVVGARSRTLALFCFAPGARRLVRDARAARPPRPGSCSCRRRSRSSSRAAAPATRSPRLRRARARASDLRALPARPARGVTRSCARGEWRTSAPLLAAARRADRRSSLLWLRPLVDETVSHDPEPGERLRGAAALRRPARRARRAPLPARGRGARPQRRRRGRRAAPAAARRARDPTPLGGVRRSAARWRSSSLMRGAVALRALLRRGLALAVAPRRRASRRCRSRSPAGSRCSPRPAGVAAARARRRHRRCSALWPGDFDVRPAARRPGARDLDRARRRRCSRSSPGSCSGAATCASATRSARPRPRCFVLPVVVHGFWHWSPRVHGAIPTRSRRGSSTDLRTKVPKGAS